MSNRITPLSGSLETIRYELIQKLKSLDGFKDQTESSIGMTIIRLFSYVADVLSYRINVLSNENYLETCQIKDNMLKLIKILNYKPKRAIPSNGEVNLYIREAGLANIVIPQGTKLSTADGILFYTMYENELIAGSKTLTAQIVQGIQKEEFVKSSGDKNQEFILNSTNKNYYFGDTILPGTADEYKAEWTEVDSLANAEATDNFYYLETISDYAVKVVFGDNIFGKIPPANANIKFQYNLNLGKYGNVNQYTITSILDNISDIVLDPVNVYVDHLESFLNGGDPENIEEIRSNAPNYFKAGDVAITDQGFIALIRNNFSNILDVFVYGEEDVTPPNFKLYNQVNILILLADTDGSPLEPTTNNENYLSFYRDVDNLIKAKRGLTVWRKYIVPTAVKLQFKVRYGRIAGYTNSELQAAITGVIEGYLRTYGRLATTIKTSDIIHDIEEIEGIDYCYLEIKRDTDTAYSTENITTGETEFTTAADGTYISMIEG
jgi:hypothetical protein